MINLKNYTEKKKRLLLYIKKKKEQLRIILRIRKCFLWNVKIKIMKKRERVLLVKLQDIMN